MDKAQVAFLRILIEDVQRAIDSIAHSESQSDRRNLIRTIIAAAEGISWVLRIHVLSIAKEFEVSTPQIEMAFAEASFSVTEKGNIQIQARYFSLPAMIRLVTKVARSFCPTLNIEFGDGGWENLRNTIAIRNRITHPKKLDDLIISVAEVEMAQKGLFWLFDMSNSVTEQTIDLLRKRLNLARDIIRKLKSGDPDTLDLLSSASRNTRLINPVIPCPEPLDTSGVWPPFPGGHAAAFFSSG